MSGFTVDTAPRFAKVLLNNVFGVNAEYDTYYVEGAAVLDAGWCHVSKDDGGMSSYPRWRVQHVEWQ